MRDRGVRDHWSCEAGLCFAAAVCVCGCVCAHVCERERECEREKESNYALVVRGRNRKNVFLVRDQEQECTLCSTQVCVVYI